MAAVLVAWSGLFDVGASSGHWRITDWFLHFAMRSSVRTHALGIDMPPVDTGAVQPAAAHYARGCAICHGGPGVPRPASVRAMLPQPPDLAPLIGTWTDAQLYWIVKHGVRFTGMPAWPSQDRDDEVWAMVAFLRKLSRLDSKTYRQLSSGNPAEDVTFRATAVLPSRPGNAAFKMALADCARCHGMEGQGRSRVMPVIAGQSESYLRASLEAYARGQRPSGIMELAIEKTGSALRAELASYFASQSRRQDSSTDNEQLVARGEKIAEQGIPSAKVPPCLECHDGRGRNRIYPLLFGQRSAYLESQLRVAWQLIMRMACQRFQRVSRALYLRMCS
ncbi:c-type cytochrome [Mesorhizobium sp.]|uniref:c-type cytochrome n=1 Tax=Mesorhizobium sp. TaxID=1871066 RepID=UPI00258BE722|nr:c-type cytochrome [Mesorhizobium sp.]